MADDSIWNAGIPYVADGDPVRANVTNAPTQVLADRTAALKSLVDAIEAGEQLQLRDAPLAEGILAGQVVYFNNVDLVHEKALAQWMSLTDGQTEATPAPEAVYSGIITGKTSDRVGDILIQGYTALDSSGLTNLFGTPTPEAGFYYLSMLVPGTVEMDQPAMRVRVLQYMGGGVVQVYSPQHEPITHTHRDYRLDNGDWLISASFDPTLVPDGAVYGYNLAAADAVAQNVTDALLPTVGEASFTWLYHDEEGSSSSMPCDLGGKHVDETFVSKDENGIWWYDNALPECDIQMDVVSADTHGLSLITAIANGSPEALTIAEYNGVVTIGVNPFPSDNDEEGYLAVKDIRNWRLKRGPVVGSLLIGRGLRGSSVIPALSSGGLVGDVSIELTQFYNQMIDAAIQNLNNAVTSVEDPHVITLFPSTRTSSVSCRVVIPELGGLEYKAKIFAQFLSPGASQVPPAISTIEQIPTPSAAGVTPVSAGVSTFPAFPSSVVAGNVYLVESVVELDLDGYSRGIIAYTLEAATPSPELRMINTGIRLYLP
jgi:hypothetical protein